MTPRPDVLSLPAVYDDTDPPGYRGGEALIDGRRLSDALGSRETTLRLFELPPGESLCPYHYEYVEEWLLVLDGELDLRTPDGEERLARGALAMFPCGPDGAHKVTTPAATANPARFVMFSSSREPSVAVYPDSDKVGVWVPGGAADLLVRRADGRAGYYDGELGGDPPRPAG
jgi:uncharacterized cupin superfamily protein